MTRQRHGRVVMCAAAISFILMLLATGAAYAELPPKITSFRFKKGTQNLHCSVNFRPDKLVRNYTLTGPAGVNYGGTATNGASDRRLFKETWNLTPPANAKVGDEHTFTLTVVNENGADTETETLKVVESEAAGPPLIYNPPPLDPLGDLQVIYSEIAGHPTADAPGVLDAAGQPTTANFTALEDLSLRQDGDEWVIKGRTDVFGGNDPIIIRGGGKIGTMFMQDGQPFKGGVAGELYDFFDSAPGPVSWNEDGDMGFSARAQGGDSTIKEKVVFYDPLLDVHTIVYTESTPVSGLIDQPPNPSGDELLGNSVSGVHVTNDDVLRFICTPLQNCHSSRYPAFFHGSVGVRQSGVTLIGGEIWDSFDLGDAGGTPDGAHWYAQGDTQAAANDDILAVDDVVVVREGTAIGASGVTADAVFFTRMLENGDYFARGDDPANNDWTMRNGEVIVKTGDAVPSAKEGVELWGDALGAWNGNVLGEWILAGNTDNPDTNADTVLVYDGQTIVAREGDPVDVDGNGAFDDDAFIRTFSPNDAFVTDNGDILFLASLRDGAGTNLGDAFMMRLRGTPCPADLSGDGVVNAADLARLLGAWGPCPGCPPDLTGDGAVNAADLAIVLGAWGPCP